MLATMAEAHVEWHLNAGVPMGTAGCPQDACHPPEPSCWECFDEAPADVPCPECGLNPDGTYPPFEGEAWTDPLTALGDPWAVFGVTQDVEPPF